jgi:hypothetical protein
MLDKTIQELYKIFHFLNKQIFNDECVLPMILVQQNKSKKSTLGWCTVNKVWKTKSDKEYYEITICAEYLNRPMDEVVSTMLHEMVHLHNLIKEVKDCSNNNVYHNKKFKETAEKAGLIVEKEKTVGWGITKLSDKTKEIIKELKIDESAFEMFRQKYSINTPPSQASYKYECSCGNKFSLYKELQIICKSCNTPYEVTKKEK